MPVLQARLDANQVAMELLQKQLQDVSGERDTYLNTPLPDHPTTPTEIQYWVKNMATYKQMLDTYQGQFNYYQQQVGQEFTKSLTALQNFQQQIAAKPMPTVQIPAPPPFVPIPTAGGAETLAMDTEVQDTSDQGTEVGPSQMDSPSGQASSKSISVS